MATGGEKKKEGRGSAMPRRIEDFTPEEIAEMTAKAEKSGGGGLGAAMRHGVKHMIAWPELERVAQVLAAAALPTTTEPELKDAVLAALQAAGLAATADPGSRKPAADFVVGRVGVIARIAKDRLALFTEATKLVTAPHLIALVVVSNRDFEAFADGGSKPLRFIRTLDPPAIGDST